MTDTKTSAIFEGRWANEAVAYQFAEGTYSRSSQLVSSSRLDYESGTYAPAKPEGDYFVLQMTPTVPQNKKPYLFRFTISDDGTTLKQIIDPLEGVAMVLNRIE